MYDFFSLFVITTVTLLMNAHDTECVKGEVRQKGGDGNKKVENER